MTPGAQEPGTQGRIFLLFVALLLAQLVALGPAQEKAHRGIAQAPQPELGSLSPVKTGQAALSPGLGTLQQASVLQAALTDQWIALAPPAHHGQGERAAHAHHAQGKPVHAEHGQGFAARLACHGLVASAGAGAPCLTATSAEPLHLLTRCLLAHALILKIRDESWLVKFGMTHVCSSKRIAYVL